MTLQEEAGDSALPGTAPLQPYLCCVPEDLRQEREYLRTQVFPHLDSLCRARGTCFKPVDLRWSRETSTEEERGLSSQQLKISLDHIGHAPFFLCMLGHRYGQCRAEGSPPLPPTEEGCESLPPLERNLYTASRGGYPWVLEAHSQACSFMELEITQALLSHAPGTSFFYFRDYSFREEEEEDGEQRALLLSVWSSQSEYERRKMRELKGRIVDGCLPVRFFRSLSELGHLVSTDWTRIIDQLFPLDTHHRDLGEQGLFEHWGHESIVEALCRRFVPWAQAEQVLESLDAFALSATCVSEPRPTAPLPNPPEPGPTAPLPNPPEPRGHSERGNSESHNSILLLCGARGCGKSSLAAWWLRQFRKKNPGIPVVPHFPGFCSSSADARSLLRRSSALLRRAHHGARAQWSERWEERVELGPLPPAVEAFSAATALGPCVLVLDGLDQLTATLGLSAQQVKELRWLPDAFPSQCKLIVTTASTDLSYKSLTCRKDVQVLNCPSQSDPAIRRSVLLRHLGLPCMKVPEPVLQSIVGRKPALPPASLAVLGSELRTCCVARDEEEEEELFERYLETESLPELWALVIRRWIRDYSWASETRTRNRRTKPPLEPATPQTGGWVWDVLCLLHLSRAGLSREEVLHSLRRLGYRRVRRVLPQHWALFCSAAAPWIRERPDGQLTFTHQSLGQAVELLLLKAGGSSRKAYRRVLLEGFQSRDRPVGSRARVLEEVAWSLEQSKAWGELHSYLTDPGTIEFLSRSPAHFQLKTDVVRCWTRLAQVGYDPPTSLQRPLVLGQRCPTQDPTVTGVAGSGTEESVSSRTFITEVEGDRGEFGILQEPEVKGRLMAFSADVLLCLGKVLEAEQTLLQTEAILIQADGPESGAAVTATLLHVQHSLADLCMLMHQLHRAENYTRRALESAQRLINAHPQEAGDAHDALPQEAGDAHDAHPQEAGDAHLPNPQEAGKAHPQEAGDARLPNPQEAGDAHPQEAGDAQRTRGLLLCKLCQLLLMIGCADEVPGILKEIRAVNHAGTHPCAEATVKLLQGLNELVQGNAAAAERCFRAALATRRRWYGPDHQLVAEVEEHLADVLAGNGWETEVCRGEAVELYRHVIQVKGQEAGLYPPTSPLAWPTGCSLAVTLVKQGELLLGDCSPVERREALGLLERALDLRVRLLSPDHQLTRETAEVLRSEVSGSGRPRSRLSPERRLTAKRSSSRSPGNRKEKDQSCVLVDTPSPILNWNQNRNRWSQRPWTACHTSVFGPQSSIRDLDPAARVGSPDRVLHKSAWFHLPGQYPIKHPERQIRPKTITHPERQIRPKTITHPERQIRPKTITHPERQIHPKTITHPERQIRPKTITHKERKTPPNTITHPERQIHPNTITHPERQIHPNTITHPERQIHPNTITHPERQIHPNTITHPERQIHPKTITHPDRQIHPNTITHPERQIHPNTITHPERQIHPNTITHPETQIHPNTITHPERQTDMALHIQTGGQIGTCKLDRSSDAQ
ncbi:tetratricopeptide repeat protein 41 [Anguilla anguilla]|uniref:tetratricopeptide repeat protein 41 n=1 Tax=Anguilla anguilla TaxID=7936 RepID=UPI0015AED8E4|nr:tetratricopeptide repeat protein 41 [Anguilla anguilla]